MRVWREEVLFAWVVTGTHCRLFAAYHHLIQNTPDKRASDDEQGSDFDFGEDDDEMKLKTIREEHRKRKREDDDSTESESNQEQPPMPNQSVTTLVANCPPKQDDYGDNETATPGVPVAASKPLNDNNDNDSDDSHAKKRAARHNKSAKSSAEPAKEPTKEPAKGSKDAKKKAAKQKKSPKSSEETHVEEPSKNSATPSQDDSKLRQAINQLTSGEGKEIVQKVKKASIDKVPASRPGPPPHLQAGMSGWQGGRNKQFLNLQQQV